MLNDYFWTDYFYNIISKLVLKSKYAFVEKICCVFNMSFSNILWEVDWCHTPLCWHHIFESAEDDCNCPLNWHRWWWSYSCYKYKCILIFCIHVFNDKYCSHVCWKTMCHCSFWICNVLKPVSSAFLPFSLPQSYWSSILGFSYLWCFCWFKLKWHELKELARIVRRWNTIPVLHFGLRLPPAVVWV